MLNLDDLPAGELLDPTGDDPFLAAAKGDHAAQYRMADHVLALAHAGSVPMWEGLLVAEMYARMAASSGEVTYMLQLATVLAARHNAGAAGPIGDAGPNVPLALETEIVTLLDQVADEGDAGAIGLLEQAASAYSPAAFRLARQVRAEAGQEAH